MYPSKVAVILLVTFVVLATAKRRRSKKIVPVSQISEILTLHNYYRGLVKAKDMQTLQWSIEAAKSAQRWADTCPTGHNKDTDRAITGFDACGQNISWRKGTSLSWSDAINQWIDEIKNFRYCKQPTGTVGHFTQLMWADTSLIGCGVKTGCDHPTLGKNTMVYVCNYCNQGNIMWNNDRNSLFCPWKV